MGPRPDGRGRQAQCPGPLIPVTSVNGAAAGWPRKASMGRMRVKPIFGRQWGRGRMAAEGAISPK